MSFNKIGYFQLDNILQARIPCMLIAYDNIELGLWYNSIIKLHLEAITTHLLPEQDIHHLKLDGLPDSQSIVVIDKDGTKAQHLVSQLEEKGFTNVFYVTGGFEQLSKERSES